MRKWIIRGVLSAVCIAVGAFYIIWFCFLLGFGIEGFKGSRRSAALDAARPSAPYLADFARLFPGAKVNYTYFDGTDEPGFDVSVDLYERYEFLLQLRTVFDSSRRHVIGYGEPKFYVWEVASVKIDAGMPGDVLFNPAGGTNFGAAEWRKIVEKGGDFRAIGYAMVTNQPVTGFKDRNIAK